MITSYRPKANIHDDVEDVLLDMAARSGRSLAEIRSNPFHGKIDTVFDLVLFMNAQPGMTEARPSN